MKKYDSILKRVAKAEEKLGVSYAKTDGKLYKTLRIFNTVFIGYLLAINLITFLSFFMQKHYSGVEYVSAKSLILLYILTALELLGLILNFCKFPIISNAISILPLPVFTKYFADLCESPSGILGYISEFYVRHFISYVLILIFSGIMLFIAIRQRVKTNRLYKKISNNLYENYKNGDGEMLDVSDGDWENFLDSYNPYQK